MKQTLFILFSLIALRGIAAPLNSGGNNIVYDPGVYGVMADSTPTFALNNALTATSSSAIDLSSTGGIVVCITGTSGTSPIVQVSYSNLTYATFVAGPYNLGAGCWPVRATGRYVTFRNVGTVPTGRVSLSYYVVSAPPTAVTIGSAITVTGSITSAGNVSLNAGTNVIGAVGVTSTTYPVWRLLSNTTRTITGPTIVNLTSTAASNSVMKYQFSASNSAGSGFYWTVGDSGNYVAPRSYYSISTTPIIDDYLYPGHSLILSPSAATDISITAQILIWGLTQSWVTVN